MRGYEHFISCQYRDVTFLGFVKIIGALQGLTHPIKEKLTDLMIGVCLGAIGKLVFSSL